MNVSILVVSDVFGATEELDELAQSIAKTAMVIDPYNKQRMNFASEKEAYGTFMGKVGMEQYTSIVNAILDANPHINTLIGFSAGASAIFAALASNKSSFSRGENMRSYCFYGSQIRHMLHLKPMGIFELILPKQEVSFDLSDFVVSIKDRYCDELATKRLTIMRTPFEHGFMNKCSKHFNRQAYEQFIAYLKENTRQ